MKPSEPIIIVSKKEIRETVSRYRSSGKIVGFVPTMGFLHEGHLQLVKRAKEMSDVVVVSIYVNPTQFGKGEDFTGYPRDIAHDLSLLKKYRADYIFIPDEEKMYNRDHLTWVDVTQLDEKLCGKSRKGHFRGVTTIVLKLLNIVNPDLMFMGEKDFQQTVVLEKMLNDLDSAVKLVRCPTVREKHGLAMSSRNSYLSTEARERASVLFRSLLMAQEMFGKGIRDSSEVVTAMRGMIEEEGGRIDYIEVVDSITLDSLDLLHKGCRIALAVFFEKARLIDNIEIH